MQRDLFACLQTSHAYRRSLRLGSESVSAKPWPLSIIKPLAASVATPRKSNMRFGWRYWRSAALIESQAKPASDAPALDTEAICKSRGQRRFVIEQVESRTNERLSTVAYSSLYQRSDGLLNITLQGGDSTPTISELSSQP